MSETHTSIYSVCFKKQGVKIAIDQGFPLKMVPILINRGYNVVYVAEWAQGDEWWLREALGRGCEIFVSRDGDVRNFADANEVLCITPKRGLGGDDLMMSIVQRLDVAVSRIK